MKILRLTSENVKRLSVVEITPDGAPVVVVAGENEQGKSSVLDSIAYALGGKDLLPTKPIREGQKRAEVMVDLGEYIVRRTFTPSGSTLAVMNRDGVKYPSPQALLDALVGRLSFDPLAFANQKPADQAATLRALARIDTTDIELARKAAYDERTLVNRDVTQLQAAIAKMPLHQGIGTEMADPEALTAQLAAADKLADEAATAQRACEAATQKRAAVSENLSRATVRVAKLRAELEAAEAEEETLTMALSVACDAVDRAELLARGAAVNVPDRTALRQQVGEIADRNRKASENSRRAEADAQLAEKRAAAEALTAKIDSLDQQKADLLKRATFPVEGLGLDEHGVTWNGLPFDQAATSIRLRASVAIGLALNPKLKVLLIHAGNDLGPANLKAIAEQAAEAGGQLWIERIAGGDGHQTVVIEDGAVASTGKAVAA